MSSLKEYTVRIKKAKWNAALQLLDEMYHNDILPDTIHYNAAISVCSKACRLRNALELFDGMQERCLEPNVITYNALISACEKSP